MNTQKAYPRTRFPLYGAPPAGYFLNFVDFKEGSGYVVMGKFSYSATGTPSLTTKDTVADVASISDSALVPDPGSVNPWTPGTPVYAPNRSYRLLAVPQPNAAVAPESMASALQEIPNKMFWTVGLKGGSWQNRNYFPFDDYDNWGFGGPASANYPTFMQVNLATGEIEPCDTKTRPVEAGGLYQLYPEDATTPKVCIGCPPSPYNLWDNHINPNYYDGYEGEPAQPATRASRRTITQRVVKAHAVKAQAPGDGDGLGGDWARRPDVPPVFFTPPPDANGIIHY